MCAIHTWISIFIVSLLRIAVADVCGKDWQFHEKTFTCMKLVKERKNLLESHQYCENAMGHLVYIFDKDTDDFVKALLKAGNVVTARIGLNDRVTNGVYYWHYYHPELPMGFEGWKSASSRNNPWKTSVTTSQDGWEEFDKDSSDFFVCQKDAELPKPMITCPTWVQEHTEINVHCSVDVTQSFPFTTFSFKNSGTHVAFINNSVVSASEGLEISRISVSNTDGANLLIKSVNRVIEMTTWSCSVKYNNSKETASQSCFFGVYTLPSNVICSYNFVSHGINIICNTASVYPWGGCSFYLIKTPLGGSAVEPAPGQTLQCALSYDLNSAGHYIFIADMYPVKSKTDSTQVGSVVTTNLSVLVEQPKEPPLLYIDGEVHPLPDRLNVTENTAFKLYCSVTGGQPPCYRTLLKCGDQTQGMDGNEITAEFLINRTLHQTNCTCWARHIAGYSKQKIITLFVNCPPVCPTNFSAIDTDSRSVVLSWIPGFDGGRPQNFTILQYQINTEEAVIPVTPSSSPSMLSFGRSYVAHMPHNNNKEMIYNVTGLTSGATHVFGIQASNDVVTTDCPHLTVNITTQALPAAMSGNSSVVNILVPVLVCLILILVLVLVVVIRRRRQQKSLQVTHELRPQTLPRREHHTTETHVYDTLNGEYVNVGTSAEVRPQAPPRREQLANGTNVYDEPNGEYVNSGTSDEVRAQAPCRREQHATRTNIRDVQNSEYDDGFSDEEKPLELSPCEECADVSNTYDKPEGVYVNKRDSDELKTYYLSLCKKDVSETVDVPDGVYVNKRESDA